MKVCKISQYSKRNLGKENEREVVAKLDLNYFESVFPESKFFSHIQYSYIEMPFKKEDLGYFSHHAYDCGYNDATHNLKVLLARIGYAANPEDRDAALGELIRFFR
jgi:hypothetical protein